MEHLVVVIGAYAVVVNGLTFGTYGYDKWAAKRQLRRISERTLHLLALVGGTPGAYVGQRTFRHKTFKPEFRRVFWGIVAVQFVVAGGLLYVFLAVRS